MKAYRCCERLEHSSTQNNKTIDIKLIFITPIVLYKRFISPLLPNSCRYYPTCSQYMIAAIEKYGIVKGILFGIWRILRCNPFSKGGIDEP